MQSSLESLKFQISGMRALCIKKRETSTTKLRLSTIYVWSKHVINAVNNAKLLFVRELYIKRKIILFL